MTEELADLETHRIEGIAKHSGTFFSVELFSQIEGNLWMGGNPRETPAEFSHIVCLYPWEPYELNPGQSLLKLWLYDGRLDDPVFPKLVHLAADAAVTFSSLGPTLVHCQAGLNRSGVVTALALMKRGMEADDAIRLIRSKRCDACLCNDRFVGWLEAGAPL